MNRRRRHVLSAAIAAALAFSAAAASAQDAPPPDEEGPIIIGQRRAYDKLYLARPAAALNFTNIFQHDEDKTGDTKTSANQYLFEQLVEMSTSGYVLSPNLFTMDLAGSAGINENWIDATTTTPTESIDSSDSSTGTIYEWDVSGVWRPNGPAPLTLYSTREQSWIFREFGGAIQTLTTDTGAALDIRSRKMPTHLSVSHIESEQDGLQDINDFNYKRDGFTWNSVYLPSENQRFNWDYTFTNVSQEGVTNQDFSTHDARLSHEYFFGKQQQHSLTSILSYYNQSGDADLERFRWDERLRFRHTDNFRTYFDYTYDQLNSGGSDRNRHRAAAGFTHQLYDSLFTNGDIGVQRVEAGGAVSLETFADINWAYRKQIPWGLFSANLGLSWSRTDSEANVEPIIAVDQPATFTDPQPIVITGSNVDPNSIVITDPSGLLIYQPGVDYTVTQFPDRVEIDRVIGGSILPGQSVLLDYILTPLPAAVTSTNGLSAGLRYDFQQGFFKGLTLYTNYARTNQDIDTDQPSAFVLNEFTDIIYGAQYQIGNLTLGAEHQKHDSTINPFDADRFFMRFNQRIGLQTVLGLNSAYTSIDYFEPENKLDLVTASAQIAHRFSTRWSLNFTLLYRYEDDQLRGVTKGFEQQLELRWVYRQTQLYTLLRNAQLDNPDQDQSFQFVQVGLRREF